MTQYLDSRMKCLHRINPWECKYITCNWKWEMKIICNIFLSRLILCITTSSVNSTFVVHSSHQMTCFRGTSYLLVSLDIVIIRPLFDLIGTCLSIDDQVVLVILKIIALTCHQMSQHSIYFLICSLFLTLNLWFNVHA